MLGYLMYRSALVPRAMAVLGLIGGPLLFASGIAVMFGLYEQLSVWSFIATLPEFAWELTLGIWLIVKGFNPSVIASEQFSLTSDNHCPEIQVVGPIQTPRATETTHLRSRSITAAGWARKGRGSSPRPFFCPYSSECVEDEFPEAHLITFNINITHLCDAPSSWLPQQYAHGALVRSA